MFIQKYLAQLCIRIKIQYINRMITHLTLSDAVSKVYGKSLIPCGSQATEWQLFSPFSQAYNQSKVFLKLFEVPAYLYTSQQICNKTIEKFKGLLHEVKFVFVERCFQSSYYLLVAEQNLTPIGSLLKIKKLSKEKVEESLIFDYIEFTNELRQSPVSDQMEFDQFSIGVDEKGQFMLANYLLYFEDIQKTVENGKDIQKNSRYKNLNRDIRNVLAKMVLLDKDKIDMVDLYYSVQVKYGRDMVKVIEKCMEPSYNSSEVATMVSSIKASKVDESFVATVTDTCAEDLQKISQNLMNESCHTAAIDESFRKIIKYKKGLKRKKMGAFMIIFIIILIGIGAITFKYLRPRPLRCQQSQYVDPNGVACLDCDPTCQRCSGGQNTSCLSCKGTYYLVMNDLAGKTGKCSEVCRGIVIKTKICIEPR